MFVVRVDVTVVRVDVTVVRVDVTVVRVDATVVRVDVTHLLYRLTDDEAFRCQPSTRYRVYVFVGLLHE